VKSPLIWFGQNAKMLPHGTILKWDGTALFPAGGFTTIQPDSGTSPVASGTSDTLTLTSTDMTISGNSSTDTISFSLTKPDLYWDHTSKWLGIQADSSPNGPLQVGNTVSQSAPSGAASSETNLGSGEIPNNGYTIAFRIYAYRTIGSVTFFSPTYTSCTHTDDGLGGTTYDLSVSWVAASGTPDGYRILASDSLYGYSYNVFYDVSGDTTSFVYGYSGINAEDFSGAGLTVLPTEYAPVLFVSSTRKVGVLTSSPAQALHVYGKACIEQGALGIGITNPQYSLHIYGGVNGTEIGDCRFSGDQYAKFSFRSEQAGTDVKAWQMYCSPAGNFHFGALNDAESVEGQIWDIYRSGSTPTVFSMDNCKLSLGVGSGPTAKLHLAAGTTSVAPMRFTSGSLLTSPLAGTVEFLTDKWYGTITTGTARKELALCDVALTSGRVPFNTTNGRLTDSANMTYVTNRLSPNYVTLAAGATGAGNAPLKLTSGTKMTTAEAGAQEYNGNFLFTNSAGVRFPVGGILFDHYVDAGNSTTTETDLYSDTLAANTFNANGDKIFAEYGGVFVSSATATRQIKIKFAGSTILDTGASDSDSFFGLDGLS
jgi:hypothetical protein